MTHHESHPVAVVGMSAIMPDAPSSDAFWDNITGGRYSISPTPEDRWDPTLYYSEDHSVPDKTYSVIGGWVRDFDWNPIAWRLPVPPMVAAQMDEGQRWAISAARAALTDAGWPSWPVDSDRVAVILGNALGGEKHYQSSMRIRFPEMLRRLEESATLATLAADTRARIIEETRRGYLDNVFAITEDTMPGELANVIAGRVANLFNLRGMNFTTDAACASGLAALNSAVTGLADHQFDAVVTGGLDRNMGVDAFVKFCKIGALSATGTRPFDAGADGFVMGEGAALFVLKRLEDAERDADRVYAVILGVGGSSDGKGKGITAPNPVGQQLAVERAWERAGVDPATAGAVEGHGTSTRVGDASELASLTAVFGAAGAAPRSIALGSVKSNIGHLKAAAGAAGLFKMVRSLHAKQLPPSLNFVNPNPNVDWDTLPFAVNTGLRPWAEPANDVRRGGVSAFGFGGTNFHVVVEEHVPGRHRPPARSFASADVPRPAAARAVDPVAKAPLRGALVLGGRDDADLAAQVQAALSRARAGVAPPRTAPDPALAAANVRVAVDHADAVDLAAKLTKLANAFASGKPAAFRLLRQQGIFLGRGPAPKVAFLYTGQGSQYVNMLKSLAAEEPLVKSTFDEADRVMEPLLGRPLSSFIFIDGDDPAAVKTLNQQLTQTEITQPAVLATDIALTRLLAAYGVQPDMVMGHSLGEYGALVAAGALTLDSALEAVSARGREMTRVSVADNGAMAAVFAPMAEIQRVVDQADGYVVIANINSTSQAVVGGATDAVERIIERFTAEGFTATRIPVSHAFHTSIVAPASGPFVDALRRLDLRPPTKPIVANVTGDFYPQGATTEKVLEYAGRQIASPVQFVKGLQTLYAAGARVFVEVGPKKALHGFVEDVLGSEHDDVVALFTNHPKVGDDVAFNQALCGLYAAGVGLDRHETPEFPVGARSTATSGAAARTSATQTANTPDAPTDATIRELGLLFADVLEKGMHLYAGTAAAGQRPGGSTSPAPESVRPAGPPALEPVVIAGAALGLPGTEQTFDDANVARILAGQNFISVLGEDARRRMVDMRITRLVKDAASGGGSFATIDDPRDVIKLAGVHAPLDVVGQFGVDKARDEALDATTRLAIGAGFDAMRDAGIPLVMSYKTTTLGTQLPDRWGLPEALRDETGVIFASAFPGYDRFAEAVEGYALDRGRREGLLALEGLLARMGEDDPARAEVDVLVAELRETQGREPYQFDRRFLFRALSMGHSQFAEIIGARGPNTQINAACASTTQALSLAEDWIRAGRCRRVVVVSADDATGEHLLPWVTAGFLASGAAATDERVEDAATPFDRRRHGLVVGAGAAAFVVESAEAARERGIQPIAEALATITANSAFHGSRLDVQHICDVMEALVSEAEGRGVDRREIAPRMMFVSHETYTPARGGSAAAEINALRRVFGPVANQIVITNTKGFTGHAMGAGIEDVVALKALETGLVPPVPNYREPDPDLGSLNLSAGGQYPVEYALRLAAGFGSQVAMSLLRWTPVPDGRRRAPGELGYAYRVVDQAAWQRWLDRLAGHPDSRLEVDHRRLRVVDTGPATSPVERSGHVPVPYAGRLAPTRGFAASVADATVVAPTPTAVPGEVAHTQAIPVVPIPPAAAQTPTTGEPSEPSGDDVLATVTGIVAEMTGYPADLLDPDLDLEADLGVDTVKQAEVFAAVRARWNLERDDTLRLRDFPTLNHVAGWVQGRLGVSAVTSTASASPVLSPSPRPFGEGDDPIVATITQIVAEMTGYPADLLGPDLDLEADLGVDTVKQAEVFAAVRAQWNLVRDDTVQLRAFPTLNHVAAWVRSRLGVPTPAAGAAPSVTTPVPPGSAPAVSPAAPAPAAAPATPAGEAILDTVTGIVADMTGYPADLLDPDLDLEADLGVDTVKQAEVFAAVRAQWNLERDDTLQLREFPTLNHVAGWVRGKLGEPEPTADAASAPSSPVAAPASPAGDAILDTVTGIVADMTGYPADLLDPDLDLEADLGVDTVKQAEVFAAVRAQWNLERDDTLQLREFPTLNHVAGWVRGKLATSDAGTPATVGPEAPETAQPHPAVPSTVVGDLDAVDGLPRRVPAPSLRPAADDCLPTGVSLAGARVVVMRDEGGVGQALVKRLRKAGATALVLEPGTRTDEVLSQLTAWTAEGPTTGVYWLAALDDEGDVTTYDLDTWHEALRRRVKALYATMRHLWEDDAFLVSATRLGGYHGYSAAGAASTLGGAVTGFTKSYKKERPGALVKAVDLPVDRRAAAVADLLVEETLRDPGCVEIGRVESRRFGIALVERPFPDRGDDGAPAGEGGMPLTSDSVVLVTGAAGSIVSAITADLAAASGGVFHLLDLTPAPDPGDPDIAAFRSDRTSLKGSIAARIRERGDKPTPVAIDRELARIERLEAALTSVEAVEAAGGTAFYYSVDLTDAEAVAAVMGQVHERSGHLDVLLHAAGLEISRNLPEKEPREFDLVFDVKTTGWFNVWQAARAMDVGAVVAFSSVAGRFGNNGQTDYAAANDLLCKTVSNMRASRPATRAIALDWTAWGGIGMATRGSIPKIMEMAGVQVLPPEAGVAWIRRELMSSGFSGEVVVAGELGLMAGEQHASGGVVPGGLAAEGAHGPMVGEVTLSTHHGVVDRVTLDPAEQAFLGDHRIDGTSVLPGVMGMEAFAEVASLVAPPGFRVAAVEDVAFLAPVKFYRDEPRTLTVSAVTGPDPDGGDDLVARCTLTAERTLPGHDTPVRATHFTGRVRLTDAPAQEQRSELDRSQHDPVLDAEQVYRFYFHGPAYRVVEAAWRDGDGSTARLPASMPGDRSPSSAPLTLAPRLVELCFQTAGLWEAARSDRLALPLGVGSVRVLLDPTAAQVPLVAHAEVHDGHVDALVVDDEGRVVVRLDGYTTVPLTAVPDDVRASLHTAFGLGTRE